MNAKEQVMSWLNDAYAMETSITQVLENHVKDAREHPDIQSRLQGHLGETRKQAERVKDCITQLGGSVSTSKSLFSQVMGKMQGMATGLSGDEQVKNMLMDYSTEHFEIASYRSLIQAAEQIGEQQVAEMARLNLREEEAMAEWLAGQISRVTKESLLQTAV